MVLCLKMYMNCTGQAFNHYVLCSPYEQFGDFYYCQWITAYFCKVQLCFAGRHVTPTTCHNVNRRFKVNTAYQGEYSITVAVFKTCAGGVLGLYTAMTGLQLPGHVHAVAEGNALGKGPVVFELHRSGVELIRKQAAGCTHLFSTLHIGSKNFK